MLRLNTFIIQVSITIVTYDRRNIFIVQATGLKKVTEDSVSGDVEEYVGDGAAEEREPSGRPQNVDVDQGHVDLLLASKTSLRPAEQRQTSLTARLYSGNRGIPVRALVFLEGRHHI